MNTENSIGYFGTNLTEYGHFFYMLKGEEIGRRNYNLSVPFDPENILPRNLSCRKGQVSFHHLGDYTVCHIVGSCIDQRGGTHSVFFTKGDLSNAEMIQKILSVPAAVSIINKMPFDVDCGLKQTFSNTHICTVTN